MERSAIFAGLKASLSRFPKQYAEARARHKALAPYETASAAAAALCTSSRDSEARGEIALALVVEQRRAAHPLWQAMLAVGFEPMLRTLVVQAGNDDKEDPDGTASVFLAFLEAIVALPPRIASDSIPVALYRATKRAALAEKLAERREAEMCPFDEESHVADPSTVVTAETIVLANEARARLAVAPPDLREAIEATSNRDLSLKDYVEERYAALPASERASKYERLRGARRRFHARQRGGLAA